MNWLNPIGNALLGTLNILYDTFVEACIVTYPADGIDDINKTLNDSSEDYNSYDGRNYRTDNITVLSSILGLSNRQLVRYQHQSWTNIWHNFIGWQPDTSRRRLLVNALLMIPLNIIATPLKFFANFLRIGLEVIPYTVSMFTMNISIKIMKTSFKLMTTHDEDTGHLRKARNVIAGLIGLVAGTVLYLSGNALKNFYYIGRAAGRPAYSVRLAWATGNQYNGMRGKIMGGVFVAASIVATFGLFALFFPLISAASIHLPGAITSLGGAVVKAVSPILSPIGKVVTPFISILVKNLTMNIVRSLGFIPSMPALMGLGTIVGIAASTLGTGIDRLTEKFKNWWHARSPEPYAPVATVEPTPLPANTHSVINLKLSSSSTGSVTPPSTPVRVPTPPVPAEKKPARSASSSSLELVSQTEREEKPVRKMSMG